MKGTKERIEKLETNTREIIKSEQRQISLETHENQLKAKHQKQRSPGTCEV